MDSLLPGAEGQDQGESCPITRRRILSCHRPTKSSSLNAAAIPRLQVFLRATLIFLCSFSFRLHAQKETAPAPHTLSSDEAAKQGKQLADEIIAEKPTENIINTGTMTIRGNGRRTQLPIKFEVIAKPTDWLSVYRAGAIEATVIHNDSQPNEYRLRKPDGTVTSLSGNGSMTSFAGSDFSIGDLGLEFLHWPRQELTKKEMRRSRSCNVLQSINPQPAPGAYSRVVSWLDIESTNGIIFAEAYDFHGKKLKQFIPKKLIRGQLAEMEIDNVQTDSRTIVDFDVTTSR